MLFLICFLNKSVELTPFRLLEVSLFQRTERERKKTEREGKRERERERGRERERIEIKTNTTTKLTIFSQRQLPLMVIGKNRIEDSRFFQTLKKRAFPFFSPGHFQEVEAIWELNETTNETYRAKTLASPGCPQKISMIYLLRFKRYMRPNK